MWIWGPLHSGARSPLPLPPQVRLELDTACPVLWWHCTAGPVATGRSSGAAHTNCISTISCCFNPGFGAVENHRKGKTQAKTQLMYDYNWSLFRTPSIQRSEYRHSCPALRSWQLHTVDYPTRFLPGFQISTAGTVSRVKVGFCLLQEIVIVWSASQISLSCLNTYLEKQ